MKILELRSSDQKKLETNLIKLKKEIFISRFSKFISGDDAKTTKIKNIKQDIARLKTIMNENKFKAGV